MSKPIEYVRPWWEVMNEIQAENARLKAEVERLERQVNYWKIEANHDHDRWLRAMYDIETLRKSKE